MTDTLTQDFNRLNRILKGLAGEDFNEYYETDSNIDVESTSIVSHIQKMEIVK